MNAEVFNRADSVLCVVDVQKVFLDQLRLGEAEALTARICWLIRAASAFSIPIVAMAEGIALNGTLAEPVGDALPDGCVIHDKSVFNLTGQAEVLAAVRATGRQQVILCGMETDICIAQSAVGLKAKGFTVGAVADACSSPANQDAEAFARMQAAGVIPLTLRGIFYEWVGDLETLAWVKTEIGSPLPEGLVL
ncbi:MAG: isochorismatase family protein [Albidovulum sp.]|uniref:isochorismatase family protein n=1 Tax=Albidovulum sp. TaxID=1872424 RepID=UPI003C8C78AA